jgi:hypothetical protein
MKGCAQKVRADILRASQQLQIPRYARNDNGRGSGTMAWAQSSPPLNTSYYFSIIALPCQLPNNHHSDRPVGVRLLRASPPSNN